MTAGYSQSDKAINFVPQSTIADKVGYAVVPGNPEHATGYNKALAADSANPDAAYLFMNRIDALADLGLGHPRRAPGCNNDHIRTLLREELAGHLSVELDLDACAFDFAREIRDDAAEFSAMWKKLGQERLTAEAGALFAQHHSVTPLGRRRRGFHAETWPRG